MHIDKQCQNTWDSIVYLLPLHIDEENRWKTVILTKCFVLYKIAPSGNISRPFSLFIRQAHQAKPSLCPRLLQTLPWNNFIWKSSATFHYNSFHHYLYFLSFDSSIFSLFFLDMSHWAWAKHCQAIKKTAVFVVEVSTATTPTPHLGRLGNN